MEAKTFGDKKIIVRTLKNSDLKNAKRWMKYINDLIVEDAKLLMCGKATMKDEIAFLNKMLKGMKIKNLIYLFAEDGDRVIAGATIELGRMRRNHIGGFGIAVSSGYRGIGLGKHLMAEIIKLAKTDLNPKPKMIELSVYANNKPAIGLYKKMGFKQVAKLPKQMQWKGKLVDEFVMIKYL